MEFPEFNFGDNLLRQKIGSFETDEYNLGFQQQNEEESQDNKFSDTQMDSETNYQHYNFTDLVCKDYSYNTVSQMRWKTLKPFEFFQLQCDCLIDIEYFERLDDYDYWSEKENPMFKVRPICKIYQFDSFGAYQLETSITGLIDFEMPIKRLYDTQNQQAYILAKMLEKAKLELQQLTELNQRLKSIFHINYLKEKLDTNFEKSFQMAQNLSRQLVKEGQEYFVLLIIRVCPETMTYKLSMVLQSNQLGKLISNNDIELLHRLALKQSMPYVFDVRSIINMCQNMYTTKDRYQINIQTLDQDILPCDLEIEKVLLSTCEISQGIFLPDICVVQKYNINPKMVKSIAQQRVINNNKYITYENDERVEQQKQFINKYYSNQLQMKQIANNSNDSYNEYSSETKQNNRTMIKVTL